MISIPELQAYLKSQPIAPVFEALRDDEKNDEIALKFMFIVNYMALQTGLYQSIFGSNQLKLLHQLLGFRSYKLFTYYHYVSNEKFRGKNLHCKIGVCQFFGPYMTTLTHMAINHDKHFSSKMCAYCCRIKLKAHFDDDSFQHCYEKYLQRDEILDMDTEATAMDEILTDFYKNLKIFAESVGVCSLRALHHFDGRGRIVERVRGRDNADLIVVFQHASKPKPFDTDKLNREFSKAMDALYGNNRPGTSMNQSNLPLIVKLDECSNSDEEVVLVDTVQAQQAPIATGFKNGLAFSLDSRSGTPTCAPSTYAHSIYAPSTYAPSTSATSTTNNVDYGMNNPQPGPFIQMISNGYEKIKNRKIRRKLEKNIFDAIAAAEDEEEEINQD